MKNAKMWGIGSLVAILLVGGGFAFGDSNREKDPFDVQNTTFHEGTNITFGYMMDNSGVQQVTINSTAKGATFLNNVTITQTATVAIPLLSGVRKVSITGVTGILAGDRVLLTPVSSTPSGYALADVVATANGTLEVTMTAPAVVLGGSYSIPCKVTVFR